MSLRSIALCKPGLATIVTVALFRPDEEPVAPAAATTTASTAGGGGVFREWLIPASSPHEIQIWPEAAAYDPIAASPRTDYRPLVADVGARRANACRCLAGDMRRRGATRPEDYWLASDQAVDPGLVCLSA